MKLVDQHTVGRGQKLRVSRGHFLRLVGERGRQIAARLEEDAVEHLLQLLALQRVNAILGGEETEDERQTDVGDGEVGDQQLRVPLAQRILEVWQVLDVQHVVFRVDCIVHSRHNPKHWSAEVLPVEKKDCRQGLTYHCVGR